MNILLKKGLLLEGGIRDINKLAKRYKKAKIYFHQDLDGVTTAVGMKNYLERNGIKVVDAEVIQYGDKEFSIKKPDASGDVMPVLVDFAHGKPMFVIHTDHHDTQVGVEKGSSTSFRHSRSNVETISNILSTSDIFPSEDIMMISTVDSADYARLGITPDEVMNYVFTLNKEKGLEKNKIAMALVTNKLLLAYKNKPKFLETLVMVCQPSLLNIYQNIVKLAKESGYATAKEMKSNLTDYIEAQSKSSNVEYDTDYGIIKQYGGGSMFKPGSYDRYVPFKLYPEANFLVITWPLGLLQASCNPFKKERALKGVDLGKIKDSVLDKFESELKNKIITVDTIKYFAEKNKEFTEDSVGFTYNDLIAIYGSDGDLYFKDMVDYENEGNFKNASTYLNKQIEFIMFKLIVVFDKVIKKIIESIELTLRLGYQRIINLSITQKSTNLELIKRLEKVLDDYRNKKINDCFNGLKSIKEGYKNSDLNSLFEIINYEFKTDLNLLFKILIYSNKLSKLMIRDQDKENQEIYINRRDEFFKLKNEFFKEISFFGKEYKEIFGGIGSLSYMPNTSKEGYTITKWGTALKRILEKPYSKLNEKEVKVLKMLKLTGWDIIQSNSGGHKCITNISGLMYFGKDGVPFLKKFSEEFVNVLKSKIDGNK